VARPALGGPAVPLPAKIDNVGTLAADAVPGAATPTVAPAINAVAPTANSLADMRAARECDTCISLLASPTPVTTAAG
jgi:hypothetical protein